MKQDNCNKLSFVSYKVDTHWSYISSDIQTLWVICHEAEADVKGCEGEVVGDGYRNGA